MAKAGDYPEWVGRTNGRGVPDRAVVVLGTVAALLAAVGGLTTLVEAASLVFLLTFSVVGAIAWRRRIGRRPVAATGCLTAGAAALVLTGRLALEAPVALAALVAFVAVTLVAHSIARHTLSRARRLERYRHSETRHRLIVYSSETPQTSERLRGPTTG